MAVPVRLQPVARRDLDEAYQLAAHHAPLTAANWLQRFHETVETLGENPERCALIPESKKLRRELRQLLFGRKPNVFRIIYAIHDDELEVIRIRRASRGPLKRSDLDES